MPSKSSVEAEVELGTATAPIIIVTTDLFYYHNPNLLTHLLLVAEPNHVKHNRQNTTKLVIKTYLEEGDKPHVQ